MRRYFAVLMPLETGDWRAYFPDLVGCGREGSDRATALDAATRAAKERLTQLSIGEAAPLPRGLEEIQADKVWADQRSINWSKAVTTVVQL